MFITFTSTGRSTTLNIPVYEYGVSFKFLVSSFFQKYSMVFSAQIFHFQGGFVLPCLGPLETGMKRWAVEDSERPLPPLWTYSLVTCPTGTLGHALHHCLQVSTLLGIFFESECSPYYWDVHKHTPNAWPRFKSPRYTYIWLISSGHQIVHNREKPEEAISCLFLFVGARRAELSSVVATSQISLSIINISQTIINIFLKITKKHTFVYHSSHISSVSICVAISAL